MSVANQIDPVALPYLSALATQFEGDRPKHQNLDDLIERVLNALSQPFRPRMRGG